MYIDVAIFIIFLLITLVVGIYYGRGNNTIAFYALGNRNFSTSTLVSTIVATCIGGGFFSGAVTETYKQGLYFIIPALGEPISLIIIGMVLVPRMGEFLGELSIASAMGRIYGKYIQLITAIASIILCIGIVALQFKVSAAILKVFFNISSFYAVIASSAIVTAYSAFGGIRSVTFTDVLQVLTFSFVIPIISLIIWGTFYSPASVFELINEHPTLSYEQVFDISNPKFWDSFLLLLFFIIPGIQPVFFQRISMATNISQAKKSLVIGGAVCTFILLIICWIGILVLSSNRDVDPNEILPYIINKYTYPGLKGLVCVGIMSIVMSTADSYINSASIILNHDILKSLKLGSYKILILKITTILIGIFAFLLAFKASTLLSLLLMVFSFYSPLITVPFLLAIFGFRSSSKVVLIGMGAALITVVTIITLNIQIEPVIPGMLANLTFFSVSHYFLKPKDNIASSEIVVKNVNTVSKKKWNKLYRQILDFNFLTFCYNNRPDQEIYYPVCAFFFIVSIFSTMYTIPSEILHQDQLLLEIVYHSVLIISCGFLTYSIWPLRLKNQKFISVFWTLGLPYVMVFASSLLVIISNFGQLQLMIFLIDIIILAILLRWQVSLIMIIVGTYLSFKLYGYMATDSNLNFGTLQFKVIYLLLLVSSVLIAFLKPKQEYQALTEEKNEHLNSRVGSQEKQLREALALRSEFIRNVQHEYHAPMTGITGFAETLSEAYDKLTDAQRRMAIDEILKSSRRLDAFDSNISSLSVLSKAGYELNLEHIDFSNLLYARINICRKLYGKNEEISEFAMDIDDDLIINGDRKYLTQVLDNLIINAITYCKLGKITTRLKQFDGYINLTIIDEGIGIPPNELENIFEDFMVSSKTRTNAGNRGVGLALCKRVVEVHGGNIEAESDGVKGATFKVLLPVEAKI